MFEALVCSFAAAMPMAKVAAMTRVPRFGRVVRRVGGAAIEVAPVAKTEQS